MGAEPHVFDGLLHLLKASKKLVNELCNNVVTSMHNTQSQQEILKNLQNQLSLNSLDSEQLHKALQNLLHQAIYLCCDDFSAVQSLFPAEFHPNLRDLLSRVIVENMADWRKTVIEGQVSLPKLKEFSWKLNETGNLAPTCVVNIKTTSNAPVNVEMSRETLSTMVDSLSKIREQISSIAQ